MTFVKIFLRINQYDNLIYLCVIESIVKFPKTDTFLMQNIFLLHPFKLWITITKVGYLALRTFRFFSRVITLVINAIISIECNIFKLSIFLNYIKYNRSLIEILL